MGRPEITEDQREIAIELLANALRKDAHLRERADRLQDHQDPIRSAAARRRAEPSARYVEGMRDLLRVLFVDGHTAADDCLEEAYRRAIGAPPGNANGSDGRSRYH
jgi:hypothetical protein